jgi:hypothetical protein
MMQLELPDAIRMTIYTILKNCLYPLEITVEFIKIKLYNKIKFHYYDGDLMKVLNIFNEKYLY